MQSPTPEQERCFAQDGVVPLPDAVAGAQLRQLQAAFNRCAAAAKPAWLEGVAAGTRPAAYFDIPDPLAQDNLFIDLVTHPGFFGLLQAFFGDPFLLLMAQFRTVPSSPLSYVGWHYDVDRDTTPLHLKIQLYLDDVGPHEGPFAYVPGSHQPGAGPYLPVRRLESMPGHKVYPGTAGTALLFNSYGVHTSMVNRSGKARKSIILIYEKWSPSGYNPERWAHLADRLVTPAQRRLFSLESGKGS